MLGRAGVRVLAVVGVLIVAGAGGAAYFWNPRLPAAAPNRAADTITSGELERAAATRTFFGHMSVGWNVLSGIQDIYSTKGLPPPAITQIQLGAAAPELPDGTGVILHTEIGVNGDPLGKLANFAAAIRGGLGKKVDVAVLKFCFTDITNHTDVDAVFAAYRNTMDALQKEYPQVRFVHATVPLAIAPSGIRANLRALLKGDDNAARLRYNELVRETYGSDDLFDIAAVESTAPDGSRLTSLYPGYSSDGEHLNATGSALAAAQFLRVIAQARAS